jgi:hypothetical protein
MGDIIGDILGAGGAILDTVTLDLFDFDNSGGNLPLQGVGTGLGTNPRDKVDPEKNYNLGHVPSTLLPGQIVSIRFPNGRIRKYRLERVRNRPQRRTAKQNLDSLQNQVISALIARKK